MCPYPVSFAWVYGREKGKNKGEAKREARVRQKSYKRPIYAIELTDKQKISAQ